MNNCQWCGLTHPGVCPKVKAIEFDGDGVTVKRIEFHAPNAHWPALQANPANYPGGLRDIILCQSDRVAKQGTTP